MKKSETKMDIIRRMYGTEKDNCIREERFKKYLGKTKYKSLVKLLKL